MGVFIVILQLNYEGGCIHIREICEFPPFPSTNYILKDIVGTVFASSTPLTISSKHRVNPFLITAMFLSPKLSYLLASW